MNKRLVGVLFESDILEIIDEEVFKENQKNNYGKRFNRSVYIMRVLDNHLKIKLGFAYRKIRKIKG